MKQDLSRNANRFVIFSVFFTARAYYPVLAILFLDLGLSLDQFVLLNLIWAITIFLFEVPSGALADTIGRRTLLITASLLMIVEMLCLLVAPRDGGAILLLLCIVNRICSGLSEACASGADQALAYDSLHEEDRTSSWDKLLAKVMRWRAAGFVIAMVIGGLLYDPHIINSILPENFHLSSDLAHRLPILLVLVQAFVCLYTTYNMVEPDHHSREMSHASVGHVAVSHITTKSTLRRALRTTTSTARWVFTRPAMVVVLIIGVAIDSIVRNFATINSSYFRLIDLPEWSYGFIGAAMGVLSWFVPAIAKQLNTRFSMLFNLGFIAVCTVIGLAAIIPAWAFYGVLPAAFLMMMMGFLEFTMSRVMNQESDSAKRATVLSVKGLIFNLGYGAFSLCFSGLLASFTDNPTGSALRNALLWQLPYFIILISILFAWAIIYLRKNSNNY